MATKKTNENEEKKVTKKASTTKPAAKKTSTKTTTKKVEEKTSKKPATKKEEAVEVVEKVKANENNNFEELQNEIEKLKAELSIIKQFKNSSDKNSSDKVFVELEKLKEVIYGLEDRVEELEYQISEKDDY